MSTGSYFDNIYELTGKKQLVGCVGIDPSPKFIDLINTPSRNLTPSSTANKIELYSKSIIDAAHSTWFVVKLQIAWFEAAGVAGMSALQSVVEYAHEAGVSVILDAKRGDIDISAQAYAKAWLGKEASSGICADALTVNPLLGEKSLRVMAEVAAQRQCGLYVLLYTSNTDAHKLQQATLANGKPWWELVAQAIKDTDIAVGQGTLGAVVGATHPTVVAEARKLLPNAPILSPGLGAQGGKASDLIFDNQESNGFILLPISRSLLPSENMSKNDFCHHVSTMITNFEQSFRTKTERPTSR